MVSFEELIEKLDLIARRFKKVYKCLYKTQVPQTPTKKRHVLNIVELSNEFSEVISNEMAETATDKKAKFISKMWEITWRRRLLLSRPS